MIPYEIISTGSKGNAIILDNAVQIDCGVPYRDLEPYIRRIRLVLLTHAHGDHLNPRTVRRLAAERPLLRFACGSWLSPRLLDAGVPADRIDILDCGIIYDYGFCSVSAFDLSHDIRNCGWKVWTDNGNALYATDTQNLHGVTARGFDVYFVEANYEEAELRERMEEKRAAGEFAYERRVLKTHLSKQAADDWLYENMGPQSTYIYMHCHADKESDAG